MILLAALWCLGGVPLLVGVLFASAALTSAMQLPGEILLACVLMVVLFLGALSTGLFLLAVLLCCCECIRGPSGLTTWEVDCSDVQ